MKTNINRTMNVLNGYYLQSDNTINADYLCEALTMWAMNTQKLYNAVAYTKRKMTSVVWETLVDLTNDHIKSQGYKDCLCTNYQLKQWLNEYGNGYDTLSAAVEALNNERLAE